MVRGERAQAWDRRSREGHLPIGKIFSGSIGEKEECYPDAGQIGTQRPRQRINAATACGLIFGVLSVLTVRKPKSRPSGEMIRGGVLE